MHLQTEKHQDVIDELVEQYDLPLSTARLLLRDWSKCRNLRLAQALRDQGAVARQNTTEQHRGVDGIGQVQRRLSASLENEIISLYGQDALKDDRFMDRLNRENDLNYKPNYNKKARIIVDKPLRQTA